MINPKNATAVILGALLGGSLGCRSIDFSREHESYRYRHEMNMWGKGNYRVSSVNHDFLFLSSEHLDESAAYIVFVHFRGPYTAENLEVVTYGEKNSAGEDRKRTIRNAEIHVISPRLYLDGRCVGDDAITYRSLPQNFSLTQTRALRIRPGRHHLDLHSLHLEAYDADWEDDVYGDPPSDYLDPLERTLNLRPGDVCVVITGLLTSNDREVTSRGARVDLLPREKIAPDTDFSNLPTAQQVLQATLDRAATKDPAAIFDIGYRHLFAIGVPQNSAKARAMIQEAANAGYAPAMEVMGDLVMLEKIRDKLEYQEAFPRAKNWYLQALKRGRPTAGHKIIKEFAWHYVRKLPPEISAEKTRIQEQLNALPEATLGIKFQKAVKNIQSAGRPVDPR
jgi:hypothetical protein